MTIHYCLSQGDATKGCKEQLIQIVKDNIYIVAGAGVAFGVIEVTIIEEQKLSDRAVNECIFKAS